MRLREKARLGPEKGPAVQSLLGCLPHGKHPAYTTPVNREQLFRPGGDPDRAVGPSDRSLRRAGEREMWAGREGRLLQVRTGQEDASQISTRGQRCLPAPIFLILGVCISPSSPPSVPPSHVSVNENHFFSVGGSDLG